LCEDRQRAKEEPGKEPDDVPDLLEVLHARADEQSAYQIAVPP
jgi:hypothetical protein